MNILLFSKYGRKGASSRVRSLQYLPYLDEKGHSVSVCPLFPSEYLDMLYGKEKRSFPLILKSYWERSRKLSKVKDHDAVWIEKELFPWLPLIEEKILSNFDKPYIVDYDDSIFHKYDLHSNVLVRNLLGKKIDSIMKKAAVVIAGNEYLAERAQRAGSKRIEILPSAIDLKNYPSTQAENKGPFTIGWIGTPTTLPYLKMIEEPLLHFTKGKDIRLSLVGIRDCTMANIETECLEWSENKETNMIDRFDVGIMPLPDEPWEKGKCGYKLIQYMGCFKPVIASPVGVNKKIVLHGENGFLAKNSEEWQEAFSALFQKRDLGLQMGILGRAMVEEKYNTDVIAPKLASIIESLPES